MYLVTFLSVCVCVCVRERERFSGYSSFFEPMKNGSVFFAPCKRKHKCVKKVQTATPSTTSKFMCLHKVFWTFIKESYRRPRNEQKKSSKAQEVHSCAGWKRQGPEWPRPTMFFTYTYACICTYLYVWKAEEQKKGRLTLLAWWWTVVDAGQICAPMASKHIYGIQESKKVEKKLLLLEQERLIIDCDQRRCSGRDHKWTTKKKYAGEWKLISYTFSHLPPGVQITGQAS
jgi:hypothetical protein